MAPQSFYPRRHLYTCDTWSEGQKLFVYEGCGEVTLARVHLPPLTCYLKVWLSFLKTFSTDLSVQEVNKSEDASNFTRA